MLLFVGKAYFITVGESEGPLSATYMYTHHMTGTCFKSLEGYNDQSMPTIQPEVSETRAFPLDLKAKVITRTMTQYSASSAHVAAGVGKHMWWQVW